MNIREEAPLPAVITGLERLTNDVVLQKILKGNVGLLCHSASIDRNYTMSIFPLQKILGARLKKLFGPQHGFVTDVQDNMVESPDYVHPFFKLPIHSLYSQTRIPTDEMLAGLDTMVVDLQDVGTRVYTYIHTLTLLMEKCREKSIKVVILDRPNPIGGSMVEGNVLQKGFESFVGRQPIPQRHGMTIGEVARMAQRFFGSDCDLEVITMLGWKRSMFFHETGLPYVLPSPNLSSPESTYVYPGTVLFEGTNISEGRGTTRALEIIGHPKIEPFAFCQKLQKKMQEWNLEGVKVRPLVFRPTFHKYHNISCGGLQIHPTEPLRFYSWRFGQMLVRTFFEELGPDFEWSTKAYEYEYDRLAIDLINGSDKIKRWCETDGQLSTLLKLEAEGMDEYLGRRESILLY
ncbi:MAG: hypothetical protein A2X86_00820 [Bdellovibrionales bacterium GWA2_49_15]|nr:MAG: hypothetical protein A2X86_00820 [Bdellovibrionales bacterium GWA2_49_15]HAZ14596.1 DUF1343 domain-containing protein [Bdellovibrionales bacterium]